MGPEGEVYGTVGDGAGDESYAEQTWRRAARWHAWLKSPQCTFQDRENFERWCADVTNAAAYVALCGDLAAVPDLPGEGEYADHAPAALVHSPRLEADRR
jgi:ferric-dicitrate binding protein FerR (iron transport regulator)